jgi:thioredoxin-related protein/YHS domain-containing protein
MFSCDKIFKLKFIKANEEKKMKRRVAIAILALMLTALLSVSIYSQSKAETGKTKSQEFCPVSGEKINKSIFKDYKGGRIYFNSKESRDSFMKSPERFIKILKAKGITPKKAPKSFLFTNEDLPANLQGSKSISKGQKKGIYKKEDTYKGEWLTDYEKAKKIAKKLKRPLLLDFTGSDWCGWCIKLHKEVFSKKEFKDYAAKNLVLVELDFPARKKQSQKKAKQNKALAAKYSVRGYPTIFILDSNEKKLGRMGYVRGGPSAFIKELRKIVK